MWQQPEFWLSWPKECTESSELLSILIVQHQNVYNIPIFLEVIIKSVLMMVERRRKKQQISHSNGGRLVAPTDIVNFQLRPWLNVKIFASPSYSFSLYWTVCGIHAVNILYTLFNEAEVKPVIVMKMKRTTERKKAHPTKRWVKRPAKWCSFTASQKNQNCANRTHENYASIKNT